MGFQNVIFIYFLLNNLKCCATVPYATRSPTHINAAWSRLSSTLEPDHVFGPPASYTTKHTAMPLYPAPRHHVPRDSVVTFHLLCGNKEHHAILKSKVETHFRHVLLVGRGGFINLHNNKINLFMCPQLLTDMDKKVKESLGRGGFCFNLTIDLIV